MLLAQKGCRVLVVDRSAFPSDTLSTLVIHAPGVAALRRWGVLDQVTASGCPPIGTYSFDFGPVVVAGTPHPQEGISTAFAPRRTVLDKILVDAAAKAGAEIRERFTVEDVVVEDGVVVGIRGHGEGGRSVVERARVVVGADGHNSRVARAVRPRGTTRSRSSRTPSTRSGPGSPSTASRRSSVVTEASPRSPPTTASPSCWWDAPQRRPRRSEPTSKPTT